MAARKKKVFVTTDWRTLLSMWSNLSTTLMTTFAGWYASTDLAKDLLGVTSFGYVIAVWGLINLALRNINQNLSMETK